MRGAETSPPGGGPPGGGSPGAGPGWAQGQSSARLGVPRSVPLPPQRVVDVHQLLTVSLSVWLVGPRAVESCIDRPSLPGQEPAVDQLIWSIV